MVGTFFGRALAIGVVGLGVCYGVSYLIVGDSPMVERATLKGTDRHINCLAISRDSALIAAGQQDGTLKIWRLVDGVEWLTITGRPVPVFDFSASVACIAFSPDSATLAWGGRDRMVKLLDLKAKKVITRLQVDDAIKQLTFAPDGRSLGVAADNGLIQIWDLATKQGKILWDEKKSKYRLRDLPHIGSISFDPAGKRLAVGIFGSALLVDISNARREQAAGQGFQTVAKALTFSPDGKRLAGIAGKTRIWDCERREELIALPTQGADSLAFSPDGKFLAVGLRGAVHQTSYLQIWDISKPREIANFACHEEPLTGLAWSPDRKTLATCSVDHTVKLWDAPSIIKAALE